ncbi:MAG: hypothetical protein Tsb009_00280 [Planctomycetaceae bacterium]
MLTIWGNAEEMLRPNSSKIEFPIGISGYFDSTREEGRGVCYDESTLEKDKTDQFPVTFVNFPGRCDVVL